MRLARPFVTSRGAQSEARSYFLQLTDVDGQVGHGEAAPAPRITGETLESVERQFQALGRAPAWADRLLEDAQHIPGGSPSPAVRAALVAAALDVEGRRTGASLHRLLNLPEGEIDSSVTISLAPPAEALREAEQWDRDGWRTFKVKLGGPHDEAVIRALRDRYPDKRIRVDANEAWTPAVARERLAFLQRAEVELVEQPLPRDQLEESAALARAFDIPVILDESVLDSEAALRAIRHEAGDGVNIKLAKCGGPFEARRLAKVLRDAGWRTMMGCMIESSLGLATAAAFAGVLDYADLDGNVTLLEDPWKGHEVRGGRVRTPTRPGVGVERAPGAGAWEPVT